MSGREGGRVREETVGNKDGGSQGCQRDLGAPTDPKKSDDGGTRPRTGPTLRALGGSKAQPSLTAAGLEAFSLSVCLSQWHELLPRAFFHGHEQHHSSAFHAFSLHAQKLNS